MNHPMSAMRTIWQKLISFQRAECFGTSDATLLHEVVVGMELLCDLKVVQVSQCNKRWNRLCYMKHI